MKLGETKGRLTLMRYVGSDKYHNKIGLFRCSCGVEKEIVKRNVKSGMVQSCGCLNKELAAERMRLLQGKDTRKTHGESSNRTCTTLYKCWIAMRDRCKNPRNKSFGNYGGRGIKICERWDCFENFKEDMGPHPGEGYSIDRIDNDGNYEPGNCRWATRKEQRNNQRRCDKE